MPIRRTTGTRLGGVTRLLSVQVSYQAGGCGDTENKRSSTGCAYQFCFKVRKDLRLKYKFLQPLALGLTNRLYNGKNAGIDFDGIFRGFEVRGIQRQRQESASVFVP